MKVEIEVGFEEKKVESNATKEKEKSSIFFRDEKQEKKKVNGLLV